jgi:hypothetical protein
MGTYYHVVSGTRILSATRVDLSGSDDNPPAAQSADDLIIAGRWSGKTAPTIPVRGIRWVIRAN